MARPQPNITTNITACQPSNAQCICQSDMAITAVPIRKLGAVDQSTQIFRFTDSVVRHVDVADRVRIIEMLWEVAYADGVLDPHEDQLVRRIAHSP